MVIRVSSAMWAIPKSITTAIPPSRRTLPGLRSRCTTPAAWIEHNASARSPARSARSPSIERTLLVDDLVEWRTRDEVGDEVGRGRGHVGVEDLGDVPTADPGQHLCLAGEPGTRLGVAGDVRAEELDGDDASPGVGSAVDDAHAALTDPLTQDIPVEPG